MENYDVIIVLGAQIGVNERGQMGLARHTRMRTEAAGLAWQRGFAKTFILSGGYNFGVRYDLDISVPVFGTPNSDKKPDFGKEARMYAKRYRSEASVIAEAMREEYGVYPEALILEEDSKTTQENAQYCKAIIERCKWKKVGLLTLLYHMEKALKEFQGTGLIVEPIFAEDLLTYDPSSDLLMDFGPFSDENVRIDSICGYYSTPKGGKQWDIEKIRGLLMCHKSIGELLEK